MSEQALQTFYMDLHIHIGRTSSGKPVKITASNQLTLPNVLEESLNRKGLDIIGVIDAHSPEVLDELYTMNANNEAEELTGGGILYKGQLTLICGTELEIYDEHCHGPIHVLCFFPTLQTMAAFSQWCSQRMKNIQLSSQRIYVTGRELQRAVKSLEGLFIPAHVFTPFKSLYGKGVQVSLKEVFDPDLIDGIELGLSSDTDMADQLMELNPYTFLTNSDAHSSAKIAREHQVVSLKSPTFQEISMALKRKNGRRISKNVGLHPKLGKYYQTVCTECLSPTINGQCSLGHSRGVVKGVNDRIRELAALQKDRTDLFSKDKEKYSSRPPYLHQVPLQFIPGCGPKTIERMLNVFHSEMKILHEVEEEELNKVVHSKIAKKILSARQGQLNIETGGGGKYGKLT